MCESGSVRALVAALCQLPSSMSPSSGPVACCRCASPTPTPGGSLGAGGQGLFYLPLEQGRRLKLKDAEEIPSQLMAELRFQHNIYCLSIEANQSPLLSASCCKRKEGRVETESPPTSLFAECRSLEFSAVGPLTHPVS